MKKYMLIAPVLLLAALLSDVPALAGPPAATPPASKGPKKVTKVVGELIDMGCYVSRGLRGQLHKECATRCVNAGVPMGVVTADSTVYALTQDHDRAMDPKTFAGSPDPYFQLRMMVAAQVEVIGFSWERKGIKYLEVKYAKLAPATPGAPKPAP
jgi:hypothetical protein